MDQIGITNRELVPLRIAVRWLVAIGELRALSG